MKQAYLVYGFAFPPPGAALAAFILLSIVGEAASGAEPARKPGSARSGQYGVRWKQIVDEAADYYLVWSK